jgi:very-short-patch-repair endonuclease
MRIPLSPGLASGSFRTSAAREAGLGEGRLRGPDLRRPFHGVRSAQPPDSEADYAPLLRPGERFSHASAARLWGAPLPRGFEKPHVSFAGGSRARSTGVVGHRCTSLKQVVRRGMPVSDPVACFLELATMLSIPELVAVGDHLVLDPRVLDPRDPRPHLALPALRAGVADASGRGIRVARSAVGLVRIGAESPMETRLRLIARDAGLPEPVLQHPIHDRRGRWIGWFDMAWPERRLIAEYDGDQHRTSRIQYERDARRIERAQEDEWRVVRVRAAGILVDPDATRRRLVSAYNRGVADRPRIGR